MATLLLELSRLEIESLEITTNAMEQERNLATLAQSELVALPSQSDTFYAHNGGGQTPSLPCAFVICCC